MTILRRCFLLILLFAWAPLSLAEETKIEFILSQENMKDRQNGKIDINTAKRGDFLAAGIAARYTDGILEYRDLVGSFEDLSELKRIKGIGEATCRKLSKKIEIRNKKLRNPLYVNRADAKILKYYGFSKKEIIKIEKYRSQKGRIVSNLEIKRLIQKRNYEKYKDLFRYEK